ncbi:MAG: 50S ribosomal protein L23 [archaeon]
MILKQPVRTEKAIRLIELENTITFTVDRRTKKPEIKKEIEKEFNVKVKSINTQIKTNVKIAYIRLKEETPAIDVATKLGLI